MLVSIRIYIMREVIKVRKVSDVTNIPFPFDSKLNCSIYIGNDGTFKQVRKVEDEREAYDNVVAGNGNIVIVWPGQYRSDAFLVDDINQYGVAKGFIQFVDSDEEESVETTEVQEPVKDILDDFI